MRDPQTVLQEFMGQVSICNSKDELAKLKKKYNLLLHPDKNKSEGATAAFQEFQNMLDSKMQQLDMPPPPQMFFNMNGFVFAQNFAQPPPAPQPFFTYPPPDPPIYIGDTVLRANFTNWTDQCNQTFRESENLLVDRSQNVTIQHSSHVTVVCGWEMNLFECTHVHIYGSRRVKLVNCDNIIIENHKLDAGVTMICQDIVLENCTNVIDRCDLLSKDPDLHDTFVPSYYQA